MNALQKYINNDYNLVNSYLRGNIEMMTDQEIYKSKKLVHDLESYFVNNKIKNKYKLRVYRGIRNSKKKYNFYIDKQKSYVSTTLSERIAVNNYTNNGGYLLIIDILPNIPYIMVDQFIREYNTYDEEEDEILLPKGINLISTKVIDKDNHENQYKFCGITIIYCNATL